MPQGGLSASRGQPWKRRTLELVEYPRVTLREKAVTRHGLLCGSELHAREISLARCELSAAGCRARERFTRVTATFRYGQCSSSAFMIESLMYIGNLYPWSRSSFTERSTFCKGFQHGVWQVLVPTEIACQDMVAM